MVHLNSKGTELGLGSDNLLAQIRKLVFGCSSGKLDAQFWLIMCVFSVDRIMYCAESAQSTPCDVHTVTYVEYKKKTYFAENKKKK